MTESSTFLNRYYGYFLAIFVPVFVVLVNVLEYFNVSVMFAMAVGVILDRMIQPVQSWIQEWKEVQDRLVNSELAPSYDRPETAHIEAALEKLAKRMLLYSGCVFLFGAAWSGGDPPSVALVLALAAAGTGLVQIAEVVNRG